MSAIFAIFKHLSYIDPIDLHYKGIR